MSWDAADLDTHYPRHLTGMREGYVLRARYLAGQLDYPTAHAELVGHFDLSDVAAQAMLARPMSTIRIERFIGVTVTEQAVTARAEEALNV